MGAEYWKCDMVDINASRNEVGLDGVPFEGLDAQTAVSIRGVLLRLATAQDEAASKQAALTPYWKPWPESVIGCKAAARALRTLADSLSMACPPAKA